MTISNVINPVTFADTRLNHPARQSGWDSNVGWSSMDVSVGGGQENSKRNWDYGGNVDFEHENGKSNLDIGGHAHKEWGKHASYCFCCCCCC